MDQGVILLPAAADKAVFRGLFWAFVCELCGLAALAVVALTIVLLLQQLAGVR